MIVSEYGHSELLSILASGNLLLNMAPFIVRIRSDIPDLARDISLMYADFQCLSPDSFADYHVEVLLGSGWERWVRPTAYFYFDGMPFFTPLPAYQAMAMLEWGLNWCIAAHSHQYLIFHAAVVERGGHAVLLPAPPGSGKSTLCAALVHRGWRLLSDELALFDMKSRMVYGMARPVNLKNNAIQVIRQFEPSANFTLEVPNTSKGTVALLQPPSPSVARASEPAVPRWVITPKFVRDAAAKLESTSRPAAFMLMAEQSFNYEMHGAEGFEALADLIDACECHAFEYSNLDDAMSVFDKLAAS